MSTNNEEEHHSSPPLPMQETINLKIKVPPGHLPNSSTDNFDLGAVSLSATVGTLRQKIQSLIPSNPVPERQRLLYGGRALVDNDQTVQDALNTKRDPGQREYVIHLLVKGEALSTGGGGERAISATRLTHGRAGSAPPSGAAVGPRQQPNGQPGGVAQQAQMPEQPQVQLPPHLLAQQQQMMAQRQQQMAQNLGMGMGMPAPPAGFMMPLQQFMGQIPGMPGVPFPQQMRPPMMAQPTPQNLMVQNQHAPQPTPQAPNLEPNTAAPANEGMTIRRADGQEQTNPLPTPTTQAQQQQQPPHQHHHHQQGGPWSTYRIETRGPNGERMQMQQIVGSFPVQPPGAQGHPQAQGHQHFHAFPGPQAFLPGALPPGMPGMSMPVHGVPPSPGVPGMPMLPQQIMLPPHLALQQQLRQQQNGAGGSGETRSALDRARENMREMQRVLDEVRGSASEEQRQRIGEAQDRARQVEGYIDPMNLGGSAGGNTRARTGDDAAAGNATSTRLSSSVPPPVQRTRPAGQEGPRDFRTIFSLPPQQQELQPAATSNTTTAYLLSNPQGAPQALLFSPTHGTYTGNALLPSQPQLASATIPHPTRTQHPPPDPVAQAAAAHLAQGAQAQQQNAGPNQDPLAVLQPLFQHFWLLLRILIFAYFLLGSNMGNMRTMLLVGIGMVFWAVRAGVLGDLGAVRRWWEGVVGVPQAGRREGQGNAADANVGGGQQQAPGQTPQAPQPDGGAQQQPQQREGMPTPNQVAQRLLNQNQEDRRTWVREQIRPVERAVALFVASLWPGIGEAHVRARREEEQRRLQEEEVEARRRTEVEAARTQQEGEKEGGENAGGENKDSRGSAEVEKKDPVEGGESSGQQTKSGEGGNVDQTGVRSTG